MIRRRTAGEKMVGVEGQGKGTTDQERTGVTKRRQETREDAWEGRGQETGKTMNGLGERWGRGGPCTTTTLHGTLFRGGRSGVRSSGFFQAVDSFGYRVRGSAQRTAACFTASFFFHPYPAVTTSVSSDSSPPLLFLVILSRSVGCSLL